MTIDRLTFSVDSGLEYPQEMELKQGFGIAGDKFAGKGDRHVCLLDTEVAKNVKTLNGLCTKKFTGNFLTSGMCYKSLEVGQKFLVGTAEIEIIQKGKKCYPECALVIARTPCELPKSSAFAKVIKSGTVKLNDEIIPIY
ncbi:MAG: MOSC domain-containing protein [Clostridia bacterium]|nr:MOSC domain-containing protein [Clostridia bacterium]